MKYQSGDRVSYLDLELVRDQQRNKFKVSETKRINKLAKKHNVGEKGKLYPYRTAILEEDTTTVRPEIMLVCS